MCASILLQIKLYDQEDNGKDKKEKKMNNTMAEQLLKQRGTKRKTPNFKKSSKITPENDIIFVNIQKSNKSSQYREGITLSNW